MISKYVLAGALVLPLMTAAGMAENAPAEHRHHYQGGPTTVVPHATQQTVGSAQNANARKLKPKKSHGYSGGPQTVVPHTN